MNDTFKGQVTRTAADIYEEFFVPALFQQWTGPVAEAAVVGPGQKALDVACGTGVLTRELARRVGPGGTTVGVDRNEGMLAVAARRSPNIHWMPGLAEELPFEDDSFDAVVSQFGLMFFDDRAAAVDEMWRVLRPGGKIAVAVWDAVERSPGYAQMIDLLDELFGERIANELRGPFVLGNPSELAKVFADAKIPDSTIETLPGTARFSSLDDWVRVDVKGWTLAELIDDTQFETLREAAHAKLGRFVGADGAVEFAAPAHIVSAAKA
jgi:SAM-dependent methyltransferase